MSLEKYKVGELVMFRARSALFSSANQRYTNPGIVIGISKKVIFQQDYAAYTVLWACGRVTSESRGYLEEFRNDGCSS